MEELIYKWQERLDSYYNNSHIAKGMDENTAMGVQFGRTKCLELCIKELQALVAQISRGPLLESGKVSGRDRPRVLTPLWQNGNAPSS